MCSFKLKYLFLIDVNNNSNSFLEHFKKYRIYYKISGILIAVFSKYIYDKNKKKFNTSILYSKTDKEFMNNINHKEFTYNSYEESYTKCFKKFYENPHLIEDLKNKILEFIKNNNCNDSEFLIKKDTNNKINFVINSLPSDKKIPRTYNQNNPFHKIINNNDKATIYYENKNFLIIQNKGTNTKNLHLLLIPKNNYLDYIDLLSNGSEEEIKNLFLSFYEIFKQYNLDNILDKDKNFSSIYSNHRKGVFPGVRNSHSHQSIHHLHFHIHMLDVKPILNLIPIRINK